MTDDEFFAGFKDAMTEDQKAQKAATTERLIRQLGGFTREQMERAIRKAQVHVYSHYRKKTIDADDVDRIVAEVSE